MIQAQQNHQAEVIGKKTKAFLDKYEIWLLVVFLIGISLKLIHFRYNALFLTITFLSVAMIYFFSAFADESEPLSGFEIFINKLACMASSIAIVGNLFILEHWNGYKPMLTVGVVILIILIPVFFIFKNKNPDSKILTKNLLLRIIFISALSLVLYFTAPKKTNAPDLSGKPQTEQIQ
jgi:NADH:ubiquinone oxidoreductase subunit 6 (subunit J)